jgi:hypothetical protein
MLTNPGNAPEAARGLPPVIGGPVPSARVIPV